MQGGSRGTGGARCGGIGTDEQLFLALNWMLSRAGLYVYRNIGGGGSKALGGQADTGQAEENRSSDRTQGR